MQIRVPEDHLRLLGLLERISTAIQVSEANLPEICACLVYKFTFG